MSSKLVPGAILRTGNNQLLLKCLIIPTVSYYQHLLYSYGVANIVTFILPFIGAKGVHITFIFLWFVSCVFIHVECQFVLLFFLSQQHQSPPLPKLLECLLLSRVVEQLPQLELPQ